MIATSTSTMEEVGSPLEYRVLGPLAVTSGASRVELGGKRQQLVLAVLLSRANRVIEQDSLVDTVWAGEPPGSGARSLHTYVSNLRKILDGAVERDGTGYVLTIEPDRLDALRFETLLDEARSTKAINASQASALLRHGLGLWTGRPYGDLGFEPALYDEANRLADERVAALELRFEVDLVLGRHEQIVSEIEALLAEEPYRENVAGMLMLSLYRSGRRAEALRVYRRTRERLIEDLGIEPGADLQDLELRMLDGDPSLKAQVTPVRTGSGDQIQGARGYEIHELVGDTEFGKRYRGFHGTLAREVGVLVIDELLADSQQFIQRFEAEMQTVSRFEHPHLAPILDYWRDPQGAYVVTPFYRGSTLEAAIAKRPLTLEGAIRLADQVSAGLGFLHRHGYAHGGVNPASVLLDEESNAYLADTGLAKVIDERQPVEADDVDQLGALVYRALTHRPPDGSAVSEWRTDLPSELDHAIARALHPEPALRFRRVEDFARAMRQSAGLDVVAASGEVSVDVERRNPYKGLRAFQEADASDFHGRDALVEEMVEALTSSRLVAVVGPSGSGKSSAVRAGLLPVLRQGAIPSSENWLITDMFPGAHPFEALEVALLRVATSRPPDLYETLTTDAGGLDRALHQLLPSQASEMVLVVDQFEELFSLVSSASKRRLFLDMLLGTTDESSRARILLTLRADFFDQPLRYPEFAEVFRDHVVVVSPPTRDGLTRAVTQPALSVGVGLEPGLATRIVDDVREQPGGLPLLQFALTDLFARRMGDVLTLEQYETSGGVGGALAKRAEELFSSFSSRGKEAARQMFLRLVTVDEVADDTRRRVAQSELHGLDIDPAVMTETMHQFGALRFLSFDRDPATRSPTVELAHEALLTEWDRLRTWVDERREDLLIHRRIQVTVQDWENSGQDPSYLLRGVRLEQARAWADRTDIAITAREMAFLEASVERQEQEEAERQELEAKARRRRKAVIGVLAGGLVMAGFLGAIAADRARDAGVSAAEATARELSGSALDVLDEDPELGVLLSLEAIATTEAVGVDIVPEAASALRTTLADMRVLARIPTGMMAVAYNDDGTRLVTDDPNEPGVLNLFDTASNQHVGEWDGAEVEETSGGEVSKVKYSPDGQFLAATWFPNTVYRGPDLDLPDTPTSLALTLHDPENLDLIQALSCTTGDYWGPSFGADGLIAAMYGTPEDSGVCIWDRETGEVVEQISDPGFRSAEFISGTTTLVLAYGASEEPEEPGFLRAVDIITSEELWSIPNLGVDPGDVVLSPDGKKAALSGGADLNPVEIWDLESQRRLAARPHSDPQSLAWSADGSKLAVSGNDADITIYAEDHDWEPFPILSGHKSSVWATSFHPDGSSLTSASFDNEVLIWDITDEGAVGDDAIALGAPIGLLYVGPDGRLLAGADEGAVVADVATGRIDHRLPINEGVELNPNADMTMAVGAVIEGDTATGVLVNVETAEVVEQFSPCLFPKAVSPDASLVVLSLEPDDVTCDSMSSRVQDLHTGETIIDLGATGVYKAVFSPPSFEGPPYVALNALNADAIEIYTLDGERVATYTDEDLPSGPFIVLSVAPDGRYLGIGTNGPDSFVIDMEALMSGVPKMEAVIFQVQGNRTNAPQFRVTSDGIGASASFDPVYRVWDVVTGEFLFEVEAAGVEHVGAVNFTHDGSQIVYEDAGGVVRSTPVDTYEAVERAQVAVTRSLTDDECRRYLHIDSCATD